MKFVASLYLTPRLYLALAANLLLFVLGFLFPVVAVAARVMLLATALLLLIDILVLYRLRDGITAHRHTPTKFSNGDDNEVGIALRSRYPLPVAVQIIDELPHQFQIRDFIITRTLAPGATGTASYLLRPVARGEYRFGALNIYASTPLGLTSRRFRIEQETMVPVYPSFLQMRRYELLAMSNRLNEAGIKRVRKIGHTMEFDQVREYVSGDDYRTINWRATARRSELMVNQYEDEKSQQVYSVIDKGRSMKMPFEGLSLLDYAINASLVLSNIAIYRQDKAGLLTFADRIGTMIPAERRSTQMHQIIESLYSQTTAFGETSFEALHALVKTRLRQRSMMFLYTNFETLSALQRQLPYLRAIARDHLLVVIFFENTELKSFLATPASTTEEIYIKAIAEKLAVEKKQIVRELARHGILSILTPPQGLTVNTINTYFELKARRAL